MPDQLYPDIDDNDMGKAKMSTRKSIGTIAMTALALAFLPGVAQARDWPTTGGWEITEGDDFCVMHSEFEGPGDSLLSLMMYADGRVILSDVNDDWSAEQGVKYEDVSFSLNEEVYSGGTAIGIHMLGKKGFAVKVGEKFLPDFVAAKALHIYKGDTRIDRLNLDGSAAALVVTRRCRFFVMGKLAAMRIAEEAEQRKRDRYADLPKDPFKTTK